jgi:class 3 adenylate cyclase|tara:strand:- start:1480 stop:2253 length:774 start_codon:yes stop_codon:yes gene_type:complete
MQELEKKTQFINGHRRVRNFAKLKKILDILVPSLVRDKMRQGTKNFAEIESEITVVVFDIHAFDEIVKSYTTKDLLTLLDQVYNVFDQLCDQYGLQKIETVGKTYMACGGLKSAERKIDTRLLNRHHSVRVTDFAIECSNYVKTIFLKNAKSAHSLELASTHLQIKIAIHTGPVISGVVGETKPQFSLIGETCQTTSRICQAAEPLKVTVSKETLRYLELYTNNLQFKRIQESGDDFSKDPLYEVSVFRGRFRKTEF